MFEKSYSDICRWIQVISSIWRSKDWTITLVQSVLLLCSLILSPNHQFFNSTTSIPLSQYQLPNTALPMQQKRPTFPTACLKIILLYQCDFKNMPMFEKSYSCICRWIQVISSIWRSKDSIITLVQSVLISGLEFGS